MDKNFVRLGYILDIILMVLVGIAIVYNIAQILF